MHISQRLRLGGRKGHQDTDPGKAQRKIEPQDPHSGRDGEAEMDRDHQQQRPGGV